MLFTEYSLPFATSPSISYRNTIKERLEHHVTTPHPSSLLNSCFRSPRLSKDLLHVKPRQFLKGSKLKLLKFMGFLLNNLIFTSDE